MRVLLVDDDNALSKLLSQHLSEQNYVVDRVTDGETGWAYAATFEYDLVILDWVLPQLNGIRLCQRLRQQGYEMPVLLLTTKDQQTDKIQGLEAGADDYVVKPFDMAELLVRIRVLLRRSHAETESALHWGDLCLDPVSCQVTYQRQPVSLTAKEYAMLELFLHHSHQTFSATTLLDRVWPSEEFPSEATVRSHIRGLRQKLKRAGASADLIETVHGLGYRLKAPPIDHAQSGKQVDRDREAHYLAGLTQAWQAHKGESLERWNSLVQLAHSLTANEGEAFLSPPNSVGTRSLSEQQQTQARQIAHTLAGTLGTFGLMEGYRLALQIETLLLHADTTLSPSQITQLHTLVTTLGHALDESPKLVCPIENAPETPSLLIVDVNDMPYIQQLIALAVAKGLDPTVVASIEAAAQTLSLGSPIDTTTELLAQPPELVLINLVASETNSILDEPILQRLLQFIGQITQRWPQLPVVVITPQADFGNRLDLVRRGSTIILEYPVVPADVLDLIGQSTHLNHRLSKIMIVDDDAHYLKQVIQLLHPWNFQITPLTSPQRFWSLFNQVCPDLVILDVEMPHISGFELCQVLRSHVQWQHLPIVFMSVHSDRDMQDRAFALGADDYIIKPIQGKSLAYRLLNRLKRSSNQIKSPIS
ncbi:MAG: Response regulators consisting of a CheY-like receiver domain and a winged-helix DNA-binding domain [Phormidesmis priestleyi Ana]|uniref:Response regulators consisting of a CheY-like receiver domain and a winged-helix DNA-binding domain n=1 Tax=Phormidesmis priestleyi Ana TaxID=1666911 RepID=A0A0P7ZQK2_9CYAN|nr:MAG: Response regulators consisting of a CheY-like receiver domain and a winged-helix DNA-binding domain [Phormidesmis priestleyi Ana]